MPEDTGTAALINQLTNPPNPLAQFGQTIGVANALKQFQADKAIADIYGQSIDPQTGQVDLGKLNALAQGNPAALWKFGAQMQQAGTGVQAQGAGTSAQLQAAQDQLAAQAAYLTPLMNKINAGGSVTGAEVTAALDSMPPGVITPTARANLDAKIAQIGPTGDASGLVRGGFFANQQGRDMLRTLVPEPGTITTGPYIYPTQKNPYAAGGYQFPNQPMPTGLSPSEAVERSKWLEQPVPDGWISPRTHQHVQGTRRDWYIDNGYGNPDSFIPYSAPMPPGATSPPPGSGGGAPGGAVPEGRLPPPAPAATPAPAPAPAGGGSSPTPQPPGPGQPGNVNQPTLPAKPTPAPTSGAGQGGNVMPPPANIAASEAAYTAAQENQANSANRIFTLQQAYRALDNAKTGSLGQATQAVNGFLNSVTPEFIQKNVPGADFQSRAAAYDEANKYFQQVANANGSGIGGPVTNDKLAAATAASPNVHITDLAAKDITGVLIGQERLGQYMYDQFQKTGLAPADWNKWKADWLTTHDPRAFLPRTQKTLDYLKKNVKGKELQTLENTMTELDQNGTIPLVAPKPQGQD